MAELTPLGVIVDTASLLENEIQPQTNTVNPFLVDQPLTTPAQTSPSQTTTTTTTTTTIDSTPNSSATGPQVSEPVEKSTPKIKKGPGSGKTKKKRSESPPASRSVQPAADGAPPSAAKSLPLERGKLQPPRWVPDDSVNECKQCSNPFNALLLRFKVRITHSYPCIHVPNVVSWVASASLSGLWYAFPFLFNFQCTNGTF